MNPRSSAQIVGVEVHVPEDWRSSTPNVEGDGSATPVVAIQDAHELVTTRTTRGGGVSLVIENDNHYKTLGGASTSTPRTHRTKG